MLPSSGYNEQLFAAACTYLKRGWSVIPIYGDADPARAKVAAVSWSAFQHSRCTAEDAYRWCIEKGYGGVAIVTGRVSGLAVLDFDDMQRYDEFRRDYPDLAETHTVETKRGFHLYYRVFPSIQIESRKAAGVDLQFGGKYVVAPPTVVDGHRYRVTRDTAPKAVSETDVQRLYAFLAGIAQENAPAAGFAPSTDISDGGQLTGGDLGALYRQMAPRIGRNEALFRASLRARDSGWKHETVVDCLADLHAGQKGNSQHRRESQEQRYREGVRTIASAFSRPARPQRDNSSYNSAQIPNSVREALFQLRQTYTVRVLDGLRLSGVLPGQVFTASEALVLLKNKVGRDSIYQALQAITASGEAIFSRETPAPDPTLANADTEEHPIHQKNCVFDRGRKSGKRVCHRPARRFVMPGNLELCQKLVVKPSRSDPITEDDLRSAKQTRQAAHRELIKRRPGMYPRRWLARRLGVTIRTLHGYNRDIPIQVQPMYLSIPITWSTLNQIPTDFEMEGTFLQDEAGKRYPPKQALAARLLAKGHRLVYARRTANFYSYGIDLPSDSPFPVMSRQGAFREFASSHTQLPLPEKPERLAALNHAHPRDNTLSGRAQTVSVAAPPTATGKPAPSPAPSSTPSPVQQHTRVASKPERRSKRYYRKPLADSRLEALARQIHSETGGNGMGMSLANARRLVELYGPSPVETALKRLIWLRKKGQITNDAGFMVVASRIAWRVQNNAVELGAAAPRFRVERLRKRSKTL